MYNCLHGFERLRGARPFFSDMILLVLILLVAVTAAPGAAARPCDGTPLGSRAGKPALHAVGDGVLLTVYHPVAAQCSGDPLLTADGSRIDLRALKAGRLRWCAVSRDLLKRYPYGTRLYIEGWGWYTVHDTTNKRLRRTVDLLLHPSDKRMIKEQTTVRK